MAKKLSDTTAIEEQKLTLYTALIDGEDRAVYAKDADDLAAQIAKIREQKKTA